MGACHIVLRSSMLGPANTTSRLSTAIQPQTARLNNQKELPKQTREKAKTLLFQRPIIYTLSSGQPARKLWFRSSAARQRDGRQ